MPEVLRERGHRFFFYSKENEEPPHIHVERGEAYAKVWLQPVVLANQKGFNTKELNWITRLVEKRASSFMERWNEHFTAVP